MRLRESRTGNRKAKGRLDLDNSGADYGQRVKEYRKGKPEASSQQP